ncbi:50S ribosomal protein L29, partial [Limosilactobacillus ingluviei]
MKTKDFVQELNGLTTEQLLNREKELKEQLFNLRFQLATGQLENTASL